MQAGTSTRIGGVVVALLIAASLGLAWMAGGPQTRRTFARQRFSAELVELEHLAGIRDEARRTTLSEPLPVALAQQGGPLWVTEALAEAVERDDAMQQAEGHHRLVAEVVGRDDAFAVRFSLERRGWLLRSERPVRVRTAPWLAAAAAVVGLFVLRWIRRMGAALLVSGVAAQLAVAWFAWPPGVGPRGLVDAWSSGPLVVAVRQLALRLPDASMAIGTGVVVLCTMLMAFDHRRSRSVGGAMLLWGIAGVMGALGWLEAGARVGGGAALSSGAGIASGLGLVALYFGGWRRFLRAGAPR